MKWFSIYKDGQPDSDQRILTYSECYKGKPELAFRIIDGQFARLCTEVTHYSYLREPVNAQQKDSADTLKTAYCPYCGKALSRCDCQPDTV